MFKTLSFYTFFVFVKSFLASFGHGSGEFLKKTKIKQHQKKIQLPVFDLPGGVEIFQLPVFFKVADIQHNSNINPAPSKKIFYLLKDHYIYICNYMYIICLSIYELHGTGIHVCILIPCE